MTPKEWKRELEQWHSPQAFSNKLSAIRSEYGSRVLTEAGMTDVFRDAYCANAIASIREADRVRLLQADRPDSEIDVSTRIRMYEAVEADTPNRRRGDEINGQPRLVTGAALPPDFYLTSELAPQVLEAAAKRKDRDCYLPDWGLLIYLNPCRPGGREEQAIEDGMVQATATAKDRFAEVWVVWEGTAYNTWRNSAPGTVVLRPAEPLPEEADFVHESLSSILAGH